MAISTLVLRSIKSCYSALRYQLTSQCLAKTGTHSTLERKHKEQHEGQVRPRHQVRKSLILFAGLIFHLSLAFPTEAQQSTDIHDGNTYSTGAVVAQVQAAPSNNIATQHKMLQQELRTLLTENSRINQEKIQYLEAQSQRVFWTQCLIGFLVIMMIVSLWSFWRLHVQHQFQHGIDALSTSLKHFQDSLFSLSFIDTSQFSTASNLSSFHITGSDAEQTNIPPNSVFRRTHNPNTGSHFGINSGTTLGKNTGSQRDEFSDIRGFFDAWLNVYKPGDPRYEEVMAAANKPSSPRPWLEMLEGYLQNKDQHGFETISKEIKKFFNVKLQAWHMSPNAEKKQLSDYPHIVQKITELWPSDDVVVYLERLLNNSRMSPREGFDLPVFEQLESLRIIAQRPDRPRQLQALKDAGITDFLFVPRKLNKPEVATQDLRMQRPAAQPVAQKAVQPVIQSAVQVKTAANTQAENITTNTPSVRKTTPTAAIPTETNKAGGTPAQLTSKVSVIPPVANVVSQSVQTSIDLATQNVLNNTNKLNDINTASIVCEVGKLDEVNNSSIVEEADAEQSLFSANEVRLQLALAYREIADTEGACLLLEDVIREATPTQQAQARAMLNEIEEKQAKMHGDTPKFPC